MTLQEQREMVKLRLAKSNILRRANMMHALLTGYDLFVTYHFYREWARINLTYQQVEEILDVLQGYINFPLTPDLLMMGENELADKLLEARDELNDFMEKSFDDVIRRISYAFYNNLYYYHKLRSERVRSLLIALTAFIKYGFGLIDREELRRNIVFIDIRSAEVRITDSMYVRKDLMELEKIYFKIFTKCVIRYERSSGRKFNSISFSMVPDYSEKKEK